LNFTKAAERLHLTQSAVSHQIKALERDLGEPLFLRSKRGVKLSQKGKLALEHAERILDEAQSMKEHVSGLDSAPVGQVRAAAATQAFVHLFSSLFEQFMRENPGVELSFRTTTTTDQTVTDILNGVADVGFASMPVYSPALRVSELFEDELVLVVSPQHHLARKEQVKAAEIERERLILFERGASIRRATESFFKKVRINPHLAMESNDTYFIKLMVQHGLGISLLPSWAIKDEVLAGSLYQLRIENHRLKRSVAMVSLARFQPSPKRAFVQFILGQRKQLQHLAKL
jgi:DNA-binding transcriptional LysR family regulator